MRIELPGRVLKIIDLLEEHGHEAYAVGGCVRDCVLGKEPNDWDITTSARPGEIKEIFHRTIDTGIAHGTVTVRMQGESFEVTTYRIDGAYEDGRHPKQVTFTGSLEEDLARRDFTINAMAYNPKTGMADPFGGTADIEAGIIRAVGDPLLRFSEDALRMMRVLRFSAQLDFAVEKETFEAIEKLSGTLERISAERVRDELIKLITSSHPERMRDMYESGLTAVFFPEWDEMMRCPQDTPHHDCSAGEHTIRVVEGVPADTTLRLAALLHDVAKPVCRTRDGDGRDHFYGHPEKGAEMAGHILRRWKLDNKTRESVMGLVRWHDERPPIKKKAIRRMLSKMDTSLLPGLIALKRADTLGQSLYKRQEKLEWIDDFEKVCGEILSDGEALKISDLAIGGRELIDMGAKAGPGIGGILGTLLDEVIEDPSLNEKEKLLSRAKELI